MSVLNVFDVLFFTDNGGNFWHAKQHRSAPLRLPNNIYSFWGFDSHWGHACQMRFTLMGVCALLGSQTSSKYHLLMAYITIF